MKIFLLDRNQIITSIWTMYFQDAPDVCIVHDSFAHFMHATKVECIVSPANSYGLMDGGYDRAIMDWFGESLMRKVQQYILEHFRGEQPVASSFILDTGKENIKLIHTPSMRIPSRIKDPLVVYQCMRTCLMTALDHNIQSIVIPAFGYGCGSLRPQTVCEMMWRGYDQVMNPPSKITREYADRWKPEEH